MHAEINKKIRNRSANGSFFVGPTLSTIGGDVTHAKNKTVAVAGIGIQLHLLTKVR
jgi:hypothetical protein